MATTQYQAVISAHGYSRVIEMRDGQTTHEALDGSITVPLSPMVAIEMLVATKDSQIEGDIWVKVTREATMWEKTHEEGDEEHEYAELEIEVSAWFGVRFDDGQVMFANVIPNGETTIEWHEGHSDWYMGELKEALDAAQFAKVEAALAT